MNIYFYQHRYNTVKTAKTELCRLDRKAQKRFIAYRADRPLLAARRAGSSATADVCTGNRDVRRERRQERSDADRAATEPCRGSSWCLQPRLAGAQQDQLASQSDRILERSAFGANGIVFAQVTIVQFPAHLLVIFLNFLRGYVSGG